MANTNNGEVPLEVGGKTYILKIDLNAICELEALLSTPTHEMTFREALHLIDRKHIGATRALLFAGLRKHHPKLTLEEVGDMMLEMGGIEGLDKKLEDAVAATMAPSDATAGKRPRKAPAQAQA